MSAYRNIMFRQATKLPGLHGKTCVAIGDPKLGFRRIAVKFLVQPAQKIDGSRFRQDAFEVLLVYQSLYSDMRQGFKLQVPALASLFQVIRKGSLYIFRFGVMAFNQIGVIAIHHPD